MKKQSTVVKHDSPLLPLGAMMCGMAVVTPMMSVQAAEADQKLKTVVVKDAAEKDPLNLNENNGYQGTKTRIGKVAQDPHDIPQGVTVLTRELLNDQQASSLKDALRNVSGLTFNAAEGGRAGDNINLRGFYSFGDLYLDGIRDTAQYNREIFAFEQVEVLRGAGSMLFGRGQAGGVINMVSKTPKLKDANRVTASVGSNGYQQATGDFNKKVGDTTAIRVNVMKRGEGSFRQNVETGTQPTIEREGIAPSISFGLSTNNQFTLSHYYVKTDDNPDFGISFANKLPIDANIGKFAGNKNTFDRSETHISTLSHLYRFSNNTEVNTKLRSSHIKRDYIAAKPNPQGLTFNNAPVNRSIDVNNLAIQSDISHKTTLAGMKHELLAGVEFLNEDGWRSSMRNLAPAGSPASAGIYVPGIYNTTAPITYKGDTYSVFLQDQVEFVKDWKFLLGVRHDDMKAKYSNVPNLNYSTQSYRTGLSWQPKDWAHYYLAWSDSVSPTADLNQTSGGFYPPERSQVTELGAKWLFMEGDLALRTAIFRADKQYERNTDLESSAGILTNKRRTDGIEVEVAGRITPKWNMFAGISLMDPRITQVAQNRNALTGVITNADPRLKGQITRNSPTYTYNFWTTYAFMPKWKAGLGFDAKSERYAYSPNTANANNSFTNGVFDPNKAPAYVRWDGMLAYEEKNYAVRLNVYNLTDTDWYESIYDNGGFVVPGMKQTAVLTTELKF